jgi:hypothetical protein
VSNKVFYFTVSFGAASLGNNAGSNVWEVRANLRLKDLTKTGYDSTNDWWHTAGTLPLGWTDWTTIPVYVDTTRVWGTEPP